MYPLSQSPRRALQHSNQLLHPLCLSSRGDGHVGVGEDEGAGEGGRADGGCVGLGEVHGFVVGVGEGVEGCGVVGNGGEGGVEVVG